MRKHTKLSFSINRGRGLVLWLPMRRGTSMQSGVSPNVLEPGEVSAFIEVRPNREVWAEGKHVGYVTDVRADVLHIENEDIPSLPGKRFRMAHLVAPDRARWTSKWQPIQEHPFSGVTEWIPPFSSY